MQEERATVYSLMRHFQNSANSDGWVNYGQPVTARTLAKELATCRRTICRWLTTLRAAGFIQSTRYTGRGLKVRIATEFRRRACQLPLFSGPQAVARGRSKNVPIRKTAC
jgi:MarR-like DNA-binding transcriptional regulator SgrR of sgrS sRNA